MTRIISSSNSSDFASAVVGTNAFWEWILELAEVFIPGLQQLTAMFVDQPLLHRRPFAFRNHLVGNSAEESRVVV